MVRILFLRLNLFTLIDDYNINLFLIYFLRYSWLLESLIKLWLNFRFNTLNINFLRDFLLPLPWLFLLLCILFFVLLNRNLFFLWRRRWFTWWAWWFWWRRWFDFHDSTLAQSLDLFISDLSTILFGLLFRRNDLWVLYRNLEKG